jgi:hypothetical protein
MKCHPAGFTVAEEGVIIHPPELIQIDQYKDQRYLISRQQFLNHL